MSATIRGPAAGRFYRVFHAWSRLGNVSHHQRRCFVSTGAVYNANDDTRIVQAPREIRVANVKIPQARLDRIQQHPTFLQKMHAALDATIQPQGDLMDQGLRLVRIEAPSSRLCRYVRSLLMRRDDDTRTLDNTVFSFEEGPGRSNHTISYKLELPTERFSLLQDNSDELKLRIQDSFSVRLDFVPDREGGTNDGMRTVSISGARKDVNLAKDFINSLQYDLEQATQVEGQQQPEQDSANIKDLYKYTMRSVPSSVVVLTTKVSSSAADIDSFRGMTVSSLSSVTLDPEPIVSFSIRGPSRTLDCITAGQPFVVNFLSDRPIGARIADLFSKPHDHPSQPFHDLKAATLANIYAENDHSAPELGGRNIPARFTCELLPGKSIDVGDHTVIFARVTNVWRSRRLIDSKPELPTFLAYAQAGYRALAPDPIKIRKPKVSRHVQSQESAPSLSEALTSQSSETSFSDEAISAEVAKSDASNEFVDAYWRMALDEDEGDSVLEERAADQRALGEAEKPIDHPAAGAKDDLSDQLLKKT
ncbi:hypothetical protein QM012_007263 [Aureobasidium pullulans]|uniref:Flavin reductase like domain-containing protein n=1 Tax=Aureobasidium pullulans TaxID=5580 RepID=A0ABR0TNE4_AURPU